MKANPIDIELDAAVLADLRARLLQTRWPEPVGADSWDYGVPAAWLKDMIRYWAEEWDWHAEAARMNRHAHYQADVLGLPIHFLRAPGNGPDPLPLILTHGWPWSFWDFKDVIGPLSDPGAHGGDPTDAFEVIVPSLPGFGFSTPLRRAGVNLATIADAWVSLMRDVCGFDRFAAHGGDWGALVTGQLGHAHADAVVGVHLALSMLPGVDRGAITAADYADDEQWMLQRDAQSLRTITSHVSVHSTDPQTLAYAMADSPAGTAAWIWERRRNWSDCGGDVETAFSRDHLCTTAALYWCTGAFTSAMRLYYEHFNHAWPLVHDRRPTVAAPTGFAVFPKDVVHMPRKIAEQHCDLRRWTVMPRGGHFGAAEAPDLMVEELRAFFRPLR